jgi:hypothetical protein
LGLYLRDVYPKKKKTPRSEFGLEMKWKGEQLIDAINGRCVSYVKCANVDLGTHLAKNDPNWWGLPKMRKADLARYNNILPICSLSILP